MTERVSTGPSVFARILSGEIPGEVVLSTDQVFVLRDIAPQAPVHLLVIPRTQRYADVVELADGDPKLLAHMVEVARVAARAQGATDFRLVFNTGAGAGQTVFHVHAHVLAAGGQHGSGLAADEHVQSGLAGGEHPQNSPGGRDGALDETTMTAGMPTSTERDL